MLSNTWVVIWIWVCVCTRIEKGKSKLTSKENFGKNQTRIYNLYCDFVLKNPFYEVEMPIRCELFDQSLLAAATVFNKRSPVAAAAAAAAATAAAAAAAAAANAAAAVPAAVAAAPGVSAGGGWWLWTKWTRKYF
jgi:hypothetical protein